MLFIIILEGNAKIGPIVYEMNNRLENSIDSRYVLIDKYENCDNQRGFITTTIFLSQSLPTIDFNIGFYYFNV